jgi:hypothetical protein
MKLVPWLALAALGCSVDPCPTGQHQDVTGFCVADATPQTDGEGGAAGRPSDAASGSPSEGGAGGAATCENPSDFEDACSTSADCRCDVNYCAVQPGATEGICTRTGCAEDPSVCPASFNCLDLSVFDSSLPSFCTPP